MSKPWISDSRQRASKRYAAIHADLRAYVTLKSLKALQPRHERHKEKSRMFRQTGETTFSIFADVEITASSAPISKSEV